MLIQFSFKNFKSFRDETVLDLTATKIKEFSERVVTIGGEKILPTAVIYGANASGKSNIYKAFLSMSRFVANSFQYGDDTKSFEAIKPEPFLFDDATEKAETTFEVYFTVPDDSREKTYNYGFSLDSEGVVEEWLNTKSKTARNYRSVFYRESSTETLDLSGIPKKSRDNIVIALEKQVLIISLGAKLKIDICKIVRDWFLNNQFADFADRYTNFYLSQALPEGFVNSEKTREAIIDYFSSFDESIRAFDVKKAPKQDENQEDGYFIDSLHQKIGSDEKVAIPLNDESAGTLKMFSIYPTLRASLKNGSVLFVDELNARLHPLLVRNIMLSFLNPEINTQHAQLIMTTHDSWLLNAHMLRRDEVWFTEKDSDGISTLYALSDFMDDNGNRIRHDENYEKNYLLGKYGAIPALKTINFPGDEHGTQ